jgi:hypothetical protein
VTSPGVQLVQVDVVGSQPAQACLAGPPNVGRAYLDAIASAGDFVEDEPDLRRNQHIVAERCDRLAENPFGMAAAVGIGCIKQPHATLVRGANSGDRHLVVDLTPTSRGARKLPRPTQRPGAGAESGDLPLTDSPGDLRRRARLCRVSHRHSLEVDHEPGQISPEALHRFLTLCTGCNLWRATGIYVYVGFQLRVGAPQRPFPWLQRDTQPTAAAPVSRVIPALMPPPAKPRCRRCAGRSRRSPWVGGQGPAARRR